MLPHLIVRIFRVVAWIATLTSLLGIGAATVRLLPWLVAPNVPLGVCVAFFTPLVLGSIEVALFVALPLGCALASADCVQDGTSKTLCTLGVAPARQTFNFAAVGIVFACLNLLVSAQSASAANCPGALTNSLLHAAAIDSCQTGLVAYVPVVDVSWLCIQNTPRLVGQLPRQGMVWTARGASFSERLNQLELHDVHWVLRRPAIRVRANRVLVSGFAPWLSSSSVDPWLRGLATALSSLFAACSAVWTLMRWPSASRARALFVSVVGLLPFLSFGSSMLRTMSWTALPVLLAFAALLPATVGRASVLGRLPAIVLGGTKRIVASEPGHNKATDG